MPSLIASLKAATRRVYQGKRGTVSRHVCETARQEGKTARQIQGEPQPLQDLLELLLLLKWNASDK